MSSSDTLHFQPHSVPQEHALRHQPVSAISRKGVIQYNPFISHCYNELPKSSDHKSESRAIALGKAWERGNRHERVKPLRGAQLVEIQPGQSRSGQAGSECCHSPGDWWVTKRTQRGSGPRGISSEIFPCSGSRRC